MYLCGNKHIGFTLIELLAVIILLGILGSIATARFTSPSVFELQSSRDQVISAFRSAQQLAMVQSDRVRFSTTNNQLSIYRDGDGDGSFSAGEIVTLDGIRYPSALPASQAVTGINFDFDRLGRTIAGDLSLSDGSLNLDISISSMGFVE